MKPQKQAYAFLDDEAVVTPRSNCGRLVVFGAEGLISGGAIQDDAQRKHLQRLRTQAPDPWVWYLFERGETPKTSSKKPTKLRTEQIEPERPPRVIFVAPSKAELLGTSSNAFALDKEISALLPVDHFMVLVADNIQIDLKSASDIPAASITEPEQAYKEAVFIIVATPTDYAPEKNYFNRRTVEYANDEARAHFPSATIVIKDTPEMIASLCAFDSSSQ